MSARPNSLAPLLLILLVGCAPIVVGELRSSDFAFALEENDGIFVVETDSDSLIHQLVIERVDEKAGAVHLRALGKGRRVKFLVLSAGTYQWSRIELPGQTFRGKHHPYSWDLDQETNHWQFRIEPGVINYAGVVVIRRREVNLLSSYTLNRSANFVEYLQSTGKSLLEGYRLVYSGRVRDDFLEFYSMRLSQERENSRKGQGDETPAR